MTNFTYGVANPKLVSSLSGMEFLQAMRDGTLPRPPIGRRIPLELTELEQGRITLRAIADDTYLNPGGIVHGGLALTALDTAMGLSVLSLLPAGQSFASIDTSVRFLRPLQGGGVVHELEITGEVVSLGRSVATVKGEIRSSGNKLIATGTGACAVL